MPPPQAVARWRTRAALAVLAFVAVPAGIAAVVVQSSGDEQSIERHARLMPVGQNPLRVKGTGFRTGERVSITVTGLRKTGRSVTANERGSFTARFPGVSPCDSVTVSATGSRGSRASFNLSQFAC